MNTKNKQMFDTQRRNTECELSFAIGLLTALEKEVARANKSKNPYGHKIDLSYFEEKSNKAIGAINAAMSFAFKSNLLLEEDSN